MAYTNIDDPSAYFQTALHTSANAATITNDGNSDLQPDFIWSKARGAAYNHGLYDSTRGVTKFLSSNAASAETTASSGFDLTSFNTDGFSTGNNQYNTICGGTTYVAWQWKCNGGTTSSNTDGDITSTVQVNSDAGFSIVTYTGNFTGSQGVGHGLGVRPDVVIIKNRDAGLSWVVWTSELTSGNFLKLQDTDAQASSSRIYQAGFTTSTFGIGANNSVNKSGDDFVAYCFASKQGYSKFGKYVGNGDANGSFVYTGFKPAFVIIKRTDTTNNWLIYDHKRSGYNPKQDKLYPDDASAEDASTTSVDLLSNGFKLRASSASQNASGGTYIYMAFAENPFVTSTGIPTTAR